MTRVFSSKYVTQRDPFKKANSSNSSCTNLPNRELLSFRIVLALPKLSINGLACTHDGNGKKRGG